MTVRIESLEAWRRFARWRTCTGKRKHPTREEAERNLARVQQTRPNTDTLRVYHCRYCQQYHLGNRRKDT